MSKDISIVNNLQHTSNVPYCTCNTSNENAIINDEFNNILLSKSINNDSTPLNLENTSYSVLNYGISNIPTGIINNIYSNISENLDIRNEIISSVNTSTTPVNTTNTVEVTNSNLSQKEQIEDAVSKASKKYGLDANLIKAVIKTESNFNPSVVSSAGAKGLMQIMPFNFKNLGITNPFDIYQNVDGGTKLLKEYIDKYNGDIQMGLMAYNGGPGRMRDRGVTSIAHIYKMPKETQNYVKKVMNYYKGE